MIDFVRRYISGNACMSLSYWTRREYRKIDFRDWKGYFESGGDEAASVRTAKFKMW